MSFPKPVTAKGNDATTVTNLGRTDGERQSSGLQAFRISHYIAPSPTPPLDILASHGDRYKACAWLSVNLLSFSPYPRYPLLPGPLLHGTLLAHSLFWSFGTFVRVTSLWWDSEVLGHVCSSLCFLVYFSENQRSWIYLCLPFPQNIKTSITYRRKCCYILLIISPFETRVSSFSRAQLFVTTWTVAHQTPLSMGFSR